MSQLVAQFVKCPGCGTENPAELPESANVARRPAYRVEVLERSFMRFGCASCGRVTTVERELLYSDLDHGLFVLVFPRTEASHHRRLSALAREVFRRVVYDEAPPVVAKLFGRIEPRIAFGYEQLREKVLCNDHQLDDRVVEAMKAMLLREIAPLREARVSELVLDAVGPDDEPFLFVPLAGGTLAELPPLSVGREVYRDLARGAHWLADSRWLPAPYVHASQIPTEAFVPLGQAK